MSDTTSLSYDIAIVGGGIMGSTLSYWLGALYPGIRTVLLEQGSLIAPHTSSRNTGVVHRPFYLNPETKRLFAQIASHSYPLLKVYAEQHGLPWVQVGTLEIALAPGDEAHIERYAKWAVQNGMGGEEGRILTKKEIQLMEPGVLPPRLLLHNRHRNRFRTRIAGPCPRCKVIRSGCPSQHGGERHPTQGGWSCDPDRRHHRDICEIPRKLRRR